MLRNILILIAAVGIAFTVGSGHGVQAERDRWELAQLQANTEGTQANADIAIDAGQAGSDFADLQLRTRTEAADGRRFIERHTAPPPQGTVGARAMVDPALVLDSLCRIERLRALPASAECSAADRLAAEPRIAVLAWPAAGSR